MLIVHGAKDAMRPQFHANYLKENIRRSEMVVMEEGKHFLQGAFLSDYQSQAEPNRK